MAGRSHSLSKALRRGSDAQILSFSPEGKGESSSCPSPRGRRGQGVRSLFFALVVCFAGSAWGQDLQIAGKIVFESDRDGNREIYVMNADGTNQTRLTNNSASDQNPTWSPDGTKVAFTSNRDGVGDIYVMNADGSNMTRLTTNSGVVHSEDYPISWSPDGTKIAFASTRDGNAEIYRMNADGTNQTRLTNNSAEDIMPSWSPDGTKIAFRSDRDHSYGEIYVMNADGSNVARLTSDSVADGDPSWSPDGTKIASRSGLGGGNPIYVMNTDGSGRTQLTPSENCQVSSWSPDGTKLVYDADQIYTVNTNGTSRTALTSSSGVNATPSWQPFLRIGSTAGAPISRTMTIENKGSSTLNVSNITSSDGQFSISPTNFSVSPGSSQSVAVTFAPTSTGTKYSTLTITSNDLDAPTARLMVNGTATAAPVPIFSFSTGSLTNSKIAFYTNRDGNYEIYSMSTDGTNQTNLTNNSAVDGYPSWSPDGTKITFHSNRNGDYKVYVMNADGSNQTQLTNNSTRDENATWSPDGTKISFDSARDGNYEIYVMNSDGSNQTRLTNNPGEDTQTSWSPDGNRIAFTSNRDGNHEIYVMNADGSNPTRLTNNSVADFNPSWSPDGTKIAFGSDRDGGNPDTAREIYVMNVDGTNQTRMTNNSTYEIHSSWSPDGSKITFMTTRDGNSEIYTMNADETNQTRMTNNAAGEDTPSWSPFLRTVNVGTVTKNSSGTATFTVTNRGNATLSVSNITSNNSQFTASPTSFNLTAGASQTVTVTFAPTNVGWEQGTLSIAHNASGSPVTVMANGIGRTNPPSGNLSNTRIAFDSDRDGNGEIYVMNTDGISQTRLTSNSAGDNQASWSLDGTKVTFVSGRDGNLEIYTMNTDGTNQTRLTNNSAGDQNPSWSPDETKVAFWSDRDGNFELYLMNADGTGQTRLTSNSAGDVRPFWSPDGAKIVFQSDRDGNNEIYVMSADGTGQTRLTSNSVTDGYPSWSPDGTKILFVSDRDGNREVYKMNADGTGQTRLTNNSVFDHRPSWSPDGTKIAFYSDRDGNTEIYVMNMDGTNQIRLTSNGAGEESPSWSPFLPLVAGYSQSASSLPFGTVNIGSSGQQTFTISNTGTAALTISGITVSGTNATQFTVNPASFTVNASATPQAVTVTFTPTGSPGSRSASLSITHNASESPASVSLSGTAQDVAAPATPVGLAATPGNAQVTLSWTANTEADLSHYVVYRSTINNFTPAPADSIARVNKPTTTFTNTGLAAGTYYFKLAAVDSAGNKSPASAQASVTLAPVISLSATSISGGTVNVGASGTATFTVGNTGSGALSITSITLAGTDVSQFTVTPSTFTVNAGATAQTVTVTFTPASTGNKTASLSITHNAAGSPSTVQLSGTGRDMIPPATPATPTTTVSNGQISLSWAANNESDLSHYVVYRNITNNFTPAASDSITRLDKPTTTYASPNLDPGIYYFKLAAVDSAGNKSTPSAQASATLQRLLGLSTTSLNFDSVAVGLSQTLPLRLRNAGNMSLSIASIADNSDQFSFSPTVPPALNLAPGDSTLINISFTPTSQGPQSATLTISSNATPAAITATLTGRGSKPPVLLPVPSSLAFGDVLLRSSSTRSLTLRNPGAAARVDSMTSTDSAFEVLSPRPPFNLAARDSIQVSMRFTPPAGTVLPRTGVLRIVGSTGRVEVPLSGRGVWVGFVVAPDTLHFGKVKPGLTLEQTFTVSNPGNLRLEISSMNNTNPAFSAQPRTFTVEGGSTQTVKVVFSPTQARAERGLLTLSGNADSSKTVVLRGEGAQGPEPAVVPSSLSFGNVKVDSARVGILRVRNSGGDTLKVREWAGLQPPFSVTTLQTPSLISGDSTLVRVRFAPTVRGTFSDTLMLVSNAETRLIPLSGRGTRAALSVPERLVFDPVPLGGTGELNMVLTNAGDDTLLVTNILSGKPQRFQVGSTNLVIPPNNAQGVVVRFTPIIAGRDSTDLTLSTNVGIRVVRVVGSTSVAGTVALSPDTLVLGPVAIGATATGNVELRNDRGDTLRISRMTVNPAVFRLVRSERRVPPGASVLIPITFRPTAAGAVSGFLEVRSDAPGSPHRMVLVGKTPEALPRIALSPADTLRFGVVSPGQSQLVPLTIRNQGDGVLKVVLRSESEEFVPQQTDTLRLAGRDSLRTQIRFQPARPGTRTGNLQIWSNDSQTPLSALVMQGTGGGLRFEPISIDFGRVLVGTAKDTTVALINETANAVTLTLDLFGAGFSANPRSAVRIDAGKRVPVQVRFEPNAEGDYSAKLEVRDRNVFLEIFGKGAEVRIRPPTGLAAAIGPNNVTLTWSANTEPGLSYYVVYRSQQENFEPAAADSLGRTSRTVTRFTDRRLSPGVSYYRVIAVDRQGNRSEASEPVTVTLAPAPTADPLQVSANTLAMDNTPMRTTSRKTLRLSNTGKEEVKVTLRLSGRDSRQFRVNPPQATLRAGRAQSISVTFAPTSTGAKTATLTITPSTGNPLTVALSGTATTASGLSVPGGMAKPAVQIPGAMALGANYPNPFNPETTISYQLSEESVMRLEVYDLLGQQVRTLAEGVQPAGYYQAQWDGQNNQGQPVASGVYICRLESQGQVKVRRMMLLK